MDNFEKRMDGYLDIIRQVQDDKRELERQLRVAMKTIEQLQNIIQQLEQNIIQQLEQNGHK